MGLLKQRTQEDQSRNIRRALLGDAGFVAQTLFADAGYQGRQFHNALKKILPHLRTQIVKRSDHAKGFVVLPKRWIVERTLAWLNRCRRLTKDWENLNRITKS